MQTNKIFDIIFTVIILIAGVIFACYLGGISGVINFVLSLAYCIGIILLCSLGFYVICLIFPKSKFSKFFKKKL